MVAMSPPDLAIYAGSFDPVTYGHLDLVERASSLFPQIIVAIGVNTARTPLFNRDERFAMLTEVCAAFANVRVQTFEGLAIDFAREVGARCIIRGLRAGSDFEYELQIAHANADLAPELDTLFLPTRTNYGFISASLVREIARHNGEIERYAPKVVCTALRRKFGHPER
jgi:pantetheine-phosphate adenylyltransferase